MLNEVTPAHDATRPAGVESAQRQARASHELSSAFQHLPSHFRFWFVAVAGLALDLYSKQWAFSTIRQGGRRVLVPGVFELQTLFNPGALFGIGANQTTLFLVASVLALALVLWMFAQSTPQRRLLHVALGGILAGALGNMYDRVCVRLVPFDAAFGAGRVTRYFVPEPAADGSVVLREYPPGPTGLTHRLSPQRAQALPPPVGYVRDFLKINTTIFGRELWPWVFNVADSLLVGGVAVLAVYLWRERKSHAPRASAESVTSAAAATADGTMNLDGSAERV